MIVPSHPPPANAFSQSCGNSPVRSCSRQYSRPKLRASAATSFLINSCCAVSSKSIDPLSISLVGHTVARRGGQRPGLQMAADGGLHKRGEVLVAPAEPEQRPGDEDRELAISHAQRDRHAAEVPAVSLHAREPPALDKQIVSVAT